MRRIHLIVTAAFVLSLALTASAQMALSGRATGSVVDAGGRAIKGATVKATNKDAIPPEITSTTDDRGRFGMIGLRSGVWTFTAEAPGYTASSGTIPLRVGTPPAPFQFVLARTPEPIPGALTKDIDEQLAQAQALLKDGRYDQALAAYQGIQSKNSKLTTLNLVIAGIYRDKAAREQDVAVRLALTERAIASYSEVLRTDPGSTAATEATAQIQSMKK